MTHALHILLFFFFFHVSSLYSLDVLLLANLHLDGVYH